MVGLSSVLFVVAVPYAGVPLTPVPAFVASCQSALATTDLITAVLLYSHFAILRSRPLMLLASGYLFAAAAAVIHGLSFPGLFTPTGLLGGDPQTTVWLDMIWHAGFPLFVLDYALSKQRDGGEKVTWSVTRAILASVAVVAALMAACVWIVTSQHDILPALLDQGHTTPILTGVVSTVWCLTLAALLVLWFRRPHSVLDVWLMVVLCAWLFDVALSAIVNTARYDLGFYLGRIYGLCASSFVLAAMLVDDFALQAKTASLLLTVRRRASERDRLFGAVVDSSNDAIITKALDGTITAWNKAAEALFGYSSAEAVGQHIRLIVPQQRRDEMYDCLDRIGRGESIERHETRRLHRDDHEVDVSISISPIYSAAGDIIGASKIARDITESKRTRAALEQRTEERQRIFETSQDLILVTDTAGTFVQVSPSSMRILGYRPEEMIGHSAIEFIHPQDLDGTRAEMRAARHGQQLRSFEARYPHKDGRIVILNWMGTWSEPVRRHFFIGRDVTEQHAAEAQLRQAQKMDAIGQLTGGVAHDFNNILTVIAGTIEILATAVADRPDLVSLTQLIDDATQRGAQLTSQLLACARKQPLQPREIDINGLILETARLLHPTLGEHIEISTKLANDTWSAMVDPNQLTTAILNLALNARDAMPEGGKLTIDTRNVHLDEGYASMHSEVVVGNYVMVGVSDTGSGISAANLEKVFDPFFTTKDIGKGTGLGLSMVFGFIKQSGGHIKIYSEEGLGTSVKMYLPRSSGSAETEVPVTATVQRGDETVLIVEDDAMVRNTVVRQIKSLGYTTLEAGNGTEALDILDHHATIDLLFTDVIMPGSINGRALVDEAVRRRPSLKALFTSGYTENAIMHHGRLDAGVLLLAKPYRKAELARMIRVALGG